MFGTYHHLVRYADQLTLPKTEPVPDEKPMHWKDIQAAVAIYPEYETLTLAWLIRFIGYLPDVEYYLPYLNFLRALTAQFDAHDKYYETFMEEFAFYSKRIRNHDLKEGKYIYISTDKECDLESYNTFLIHYKSAARERLCDFIGYEPELNCSIGAELYLRQAFQFDDFTTQSPFQDFDKRAMAILRYKETLIAEGEAAADDSPLVGLTIEEKSFEHRMGLD